MNLLMVFIIFYYGISSSTGGPCKLTECIYGLSEIISRKNEPEFMCPKINKTGHCFHNCIQDPSFTHLNLKKSFQSMTTEVCETELMLNIAKNSQCISDHIYKLLACFIDSSNLQLAIDTDDKKLLKCRQVHEALECPENVLKLLCSKSAADAVSDLLLPLFEEPQKLYCSMFSIKDVYDLKVLHSGNQLRKVSECFDTNGHTVAKCFKHIQNLDSALGAPMVNCDDKQNFVNCIGLSLRQVCDVQAASSAVDLLDAVTSFFHIPSCSIESSSLNAVVSYTINPDSANPETPLKDTIENPSEVMSSDSGQSKWRDEEMTTFSQLLITTETPLVVSDHDLKTKKAKSQMISNFAICAQEHFSLTLIFVMIIILKMLSYDL